MSKDVIVTVSSCSGIGKTTIAELITRFLVTQGFDATHDPGPDGPRKNTSNAQIVRENIIKERSKIVVNEQPTRRCSGMKVDE